MALENDILVFSLYVKVTPKKKIVTWIKQTLKKSKCFVPIKFLYSTSVCKTPQSKPFLHWMMKKKREG